MTWDYYDIKKAKDSDLSDAEKKKIKEIEERLSKQIKELEDFIFKNPLSQEAFTKDMVDRMNKLMRKTYKGE